MKGLLYGLGRFLQLVGLLTLPVAIVGNLGSDVSLGASLTVSSVGIAVFLIGYGLQRVGAPR